MSRGRNQERKRLYTDTSQYEDRYYATFNPSLLPAIKMNHKNISATALFILLDISMNYDNSKQTPCEYSYQELAKKYDCTKMAINNAISYLLENSLIERLNEPKGRSKGIYIPNVDGLHRLLFRYLKNR